MNEKVESSRLRENFLEPETRCDTYISAERKAAWKVMLDLLECFMRVCGKYNLRWSLSSGSLLGAMRHGGIIPWDDDVDVEMPREDYDRLQQVMPVELPSYYFMQTSLTDDEYSISHVKLRDSRSAGIDPGHAKRRARFNMGIFIDIFPIDGYPNESAERDRIERKRVWLRKVRRNVFVHVHKSIWDWAKHFYGRIVYLVIGRKRLFSMRENLFRKNSISDCEYTAFGASEFGFQEKYKWEKSLTRDYLEVPFEYLKVRVYKESEAILTKMYGDWHQFVRGGAVHNELILDAKRSYKVILKENFGYDW